MTQIQMVTGGTDTQTKALTADYHQMAQELGATTLEVAKASETWIRQGKSASDAAMLTKDSIMMAKLAVTDTATAADNLTGIMNGFQMQAKDATSVMDKMLAVSNSTKTSAAASFNEISTAMKSSAVVAQQTGVSYDQLLSYIAVASTATRQSSETTGQALPERSGALNYKYNKIQRKFPLMIPIFIP
jgi:TP901 family phage tail tape measure protein